MFSDLCHAIDNDDGPPALSTIPPWDICALHCNCAAPCSEPQYTDAGSSHTQTPMVTEAREPWRYLTDSEEDSEEDSGSEPGLDPHGFVLPPGWVTVPGENGRTFKWSNGERTVGTVTDVWASCHGGTSSSVDAVLSVPTPTGGTHISIGEDVDEFISVSALLDSLQLTSEEEEQLGLTSRIDVPGSSDASGSRSTSDSQKAPLLLSAQELDALFGDLQLLEAAERPVHSELPPRVRVPASPEDGGATSLGASPPEKSEGYSYGATPGAQLVFSGESLGDTSPNAVSSPCASNEPAAPESLVSAELEGLDRAWELLNASEDIELLQVLEQEAQQLAIADLCQIFDDDVEEPDHVGGSNTNMDDVDD